MCKVDTSTINANISITEWPDTYLLSNLCLWLSLSTRINWQVEGSDTALVSQYVSWPLPLPNSMNVFPFSRSPDLSSCPRRLEFCTKCFNTLGPEVDNSSKRIWIKIIYRCFESIWIQIPGSISGSLDPYHELKYPDLGLRNID